MALTVLPTASAIDRSKHEKACFFASHSLSASIVCIPIVPMWLSGIRRFNVGLAVCSAQWPIFVRGASSPLKNAGDDPKRLLFWLFL